MSARDAILGRIRSALAEEPDDKSLPGYELWPAGTWPQPADLFEYFCEELRKVQGEAMRFANLAEAGQALARLHQELGGPKTAFVENPRCRAIVSSLPAAQIQSVDPAMDRSQLATIPLGVMPAEFLLADTGTAVVMPRNHAERLLCYLPTVAVLIAGRESLAAHLSDVWDAMSAHAGNSSHRGEMLLVTGPSRTADIEKKLVLGAHGPKRLVVMMVEEG
jgi:L-lactate dehydrogenase complex protein LldG